ncbi:MAG: cytochrome c oxidase subunit II [Burkholderiales bacterium]|nr:MAG: cytochrome c oxidase subunit II [Burkholderiales bacterium]
MAPTAVLLPAAVLAQETASPVLGHSLPGQIGLQTSVTPIMDSITAFHDGILLWSCIGITVLVLALILYVAWRFNAKRNPVPSGTTHNTLVEVVWTVVPILVLVVIAIPSFSVLTDQLTMPDGERKYLGSNVFSFGEEVVPAPAMTIKATGVQWSWDYEYSVPVAADAAAAGAAAPADGGEVAPAEQTATFSSFMLNEEQRLATKPNQPRLLAVDNEIVVPVNATVRMQITAAPDGVIHAFAVPSFGIKIDAVPGKLNETWFNARKEGIYYGQCSELCGKDHAFMPIGVRVVSQEQFDLWWKTLQAGFVEDANETLPAL